MNQSSRGFSLASTARPRSPGLEESPLPRFLRQGLRERSYRRVCLDQRLGDRTNLARQHLLELKGVRDRLSPEVVVHHHEGIRVRTALTAFPNPLHPGRELLLVVQVVVSLLVRR